MDGSIFSGHISVIVFDILIIRNFCRKYNNITLAFFINYMKNISSNHSSEVELKKWEGQNKFKVGWAPLHSYVPDSHLFLLYSVSILHLFNCVLFY